MRGATVACVVVAVLAAGCLEAPPVATGGADGGSDGDAGPGAFRFPPIGAAVHILAALAADVDGDDREDLLLVDDDVDDDWAGVYVLRADAGGWSRLDEIRIGFRPTAAHFARQVTGDSSLVVGGRAGKVAVVEYEADGDDWVVSELEFENPPVDDIRVIHSGVRAAEDGAASLLLDDGADLYLSSPIDTAEMMYLSTFVAGGVLDAVFWPLQTAAPADFIVWRRPAQLEWFDGTTSGGPAAAAVETARFARLDADLCGAHLAVDAGDVLSVGWIDCDGTAAHFAPVEGYAIPEVLAMAAGRLSGGVEQDIALVGLDGDSLVAQVLIDAVLVDDGTPALEAASETAAIALDSVPLNNLYLAPVDAEADGSALIYAVAPSGTVACGRIVADELRVCETSWQITGP